MKEDKKIIFAGLGILGLTLVLVIVFIKKLPPKVPLFYSKPWGEEQLAPALGLLIPLGLALIILIANSLLVKIFQERFIARSLVVGALLAGVLASITVVRIVWLILF